MNKTKTKPFTRMSKADKRVAIARDVIQQIGRNQIAMKCGVWANVDLPDADSIPTGTINQNTLLGGDVLVKIRPAKCTCCATGALVVSSLRLFNKGEYDEINQEDVWDQLGKYFTERQIQLIENTFERGGGALGKGSLSRQELESSSKFYSEYGYKDDNEENERLAIAIFENIIKNKGEFVP